MKIFQIVDGFVYNDVTKIFPTLESLEGKHPADTLFVEAPDYVFEGWGYNANAEGDERFIKPIAPDGFIYDDETGTFYPEGSNPPGYVSPADERENIYETEKVINFNGEMRTVDEANKLWYQYSAEGDTEKASELTQLIAAAKAQIRADYPDEAAGDQ